jgi:hypothetical protein
MRFKEGITENVNLSAENIGIDEEIESMLDTLEELKTKND